MEPRNIVGDRIKSARLSNHTTQAELVRKLESFGTYIDQTTLSNIEHRRRPVTDAELRAFCLALGVPAQWLLDGAMQ